jgi:aspartate-semialdehyde dehydrogenase
MTEAGENDEEAKIVRETRKILHDAELRMAVTCVRVAVKVGHAEAVWVETKRAISVAEAQTLLASAPGVRVMEGEGETYPTPLEVAGQDDVWVGRVREDVSVKNGLMMWVVSDNLRKGAALNAVQIAERVVGLGTRDKG